MINITGVLVDPMGITSKGTIIRVEAKDNTVSLFGIPAEAITDNVGGYDFNLVNGTHSVEVRFSDTYVLIKEITITDASATPVTLAQLLS